jgi:hypothetical protein
MTDVFRPLGLKLWRTRAALLERSKKGDNDAARWAAAIGDVIEELREIDCCIRQAAAERDKREVAAERGTGPAEVSRHNGSGNGATRPNGSEP